MSEITIKKEKDTDYSYREYFDREKDAILLPIVSRDLGLISGTQTIKTEKGFVGKRDIYCGSCPVTPKSFGNMKNTNKHKKRKYIQLLREHFLKASKDLAKFKVKKELLLYVRIYLREGKFTKNDIDNYIKVLVDVLKEFIGDDSRIVSIVFEKVELKGIEEIDADFFEQSIIFISTPDSKEDLFKIPEFCFDFLGLFNKYNEIEIKGELKINKNETTNTNK